MREEIINLLEKHKTNMSEQAFSYSAGISENSFDFIADEIIKIQSCEYCDNHDNCKIEDLIEKHSLKYPMTKPFGCNHYIFYHDRNLNK